MNLKQFISEYEGPPEPQKIHKYEPLAIRLQIYIAHYIPPTFQEQIKFFDSPPCVHPADARKFIKLLINGSLEEELKKPENFRNPRIAKKWYFREAVLDFFREGRHKTLE